MLEIALDLNMASWILRLLFSFREAPWVCLVCVVLEINSSGGASVLRLIFIQSIYLWRVFSKGLICFLLNDTPSEGNLLLLYFDLRHQQHFIMFYLYSPQNVSFSQVSNQFLCDIFKHNCFSAETKSTTYQFYITPTQKTLKDETLSRVV